MRREVSFHMAFSSWMEEENFWKDLLPMLYALMSFMPLIYSIMTEFSAVMERLARSIRSSVLRNMTAITTAASTSGAREIRASGILTVIR